MERSPASSKPVRSTTEPSAPAPSAAPTKIRCHRCGVESTHPELFCDEPRSFSTKVHKICPQCWTKRHRTGSWGRLGSIGLLIALGVVALVLWPDLPFGWILLNFAWFDIALALAVVPHEFAHAGVAKTVGYRVFRIILGSGKVWWRGTIFGFPVEAHIFPFVGFAMATPRDLRGVRWKNFLFILAGPAANLLLLGLACAALWGRPLPDFFTDRFWGWQLLAVANFAIVLSSLIPYRMATALGVLNSDGLLLINNLFRWKESTAQQQHAHTFLAEAQLCLEKSGREKEAGDWIKRGLKLYPEHIALRQLLAHLFIRLGELSKARHALSSLLRKYPAASAARLFFMNDMAYVNALLGRGDLLAEADRYSAEALAGIPWHACLQNTRGVVLLALGRVDEALPLLRSGSGVTKDDPDTNAQCLCMLAIGEARAGHLTAAEQALKMARQSAATCFLIPRAQAAIGEARAGSQITSAECSEGPR